MGAEVMEEGDQRWQEALYWQQALEPLLGLGVVPNAALVGAAERLGLSPRQVRSLLARFRADPPVSQTARGSWSWRCRKGLTAGQQHGLMAGLSWLLSVWPDRLWQLLFHPELLSPPATPWPPYPAWGNLNFAALREHARAIAWPLWQQVSDKVCMASAYP